MRQAMARPTQARSLARDPEYRQWVDRLPAQRSAAAFFRGPVGGHTGALAVVNGDKTLSIHYVGRPREIDELFGMIGSAKALDFGPLPATTLAAATLNLYDRQPHSTELVDRLLAPKTYEQDVLPRIAAPLVLFVGRAPAQRGEADSTVDLPVIGLAIRLRDVAVAAELTAMADRAVLVASVSNADSEVPAIRTQTEQYRDVTFHWAQVGPMLAARTGHAELAAMQLSYGRIGQWFVVCTNAAFFRQCIDADADPQRRMMADPAFAKLPLQEAKVPLATVIVRAPEAAPYLRAWVDHFQIAPGNDRHRHQAAHLAGAVNILEGYQSLTAQFHRGPDRALVGRIDLVRK